MPALTVADAKGQWGAWVRDVVAAGLKSEAGLRNLRWHLDRVDLTGWEPMAHVPVTEAMLDMIESGRTKSGSMIDGLLDALGGESSSGAEGELAGIWAVSGELNVKNVKVWSDLKAAVRANGGQTLSHVYKSKGKTVKTVLIDKDGRLPRKKVADQWALDNSGLEGAKVVLSGEQIIEASAKALKAYAAWEGNTGSDKY